ncbi:sporulation transcriptional regulator SpoIIID [Paenibacillus thiaminolyticus]|nr:sporulation transcriptional regulator SpoIIID [Paenibacillus thiaminolyticus]
MYRLSQACQAVQQRISVRPTHIMYQLNRVEGGGNVHDYIKERTIKIGRCIVETKHTVRTIAKEFGVSKSTVHKDLTERLPEINPDLADQVKHILEYHKSVRHLRGGEATKIKYKKSSSKKREVMTAGKS